MSMNSAGRSENAASAGTARPPANCGRSPPPAWTRTCPTRPTVRGLSAWLTNTARSCCGPALGLGAGWRPTLGGEVLFSEQPAYLFDPAVPVFAACIKDGSSPEHLVARPNTPIRTVIGYDPDLRSPVP